MEKHDATIVFICLWFVSYNIVAYCTSTLSEVVAVNNTDTLSHRPGATCVHTCETCVHTKLEEHDRDDGHSDSPFPKPVYMVQQIHAKQKQNAAVYRCQHCCHHARSKRFCNNSQSNRFYCDLNSL